MTDVLPVIGRIVVFFMLLAAVPIFVLHVVRSLAELRARVKELQSRVDLLEARASQYERVA